MSSPWSLIDQEQGTMSGDQILLNDDNFNKEEGYVGNMVQKWNSLSAQEKMDVNREKVSPESTSQMMMRITGAASDAVDRQGCYGANRDNVLSMTIMLYAAKEAATTFACTSSKTPGT